jgi:hypothetical protein
LERIDTKIRTSGGPYRISTFLTNIVVMVLKIGDEDELCVRSDGKDLKKFEKSAAKLVESNAMRTFEEFFLSHRITVSK